MFPKANFHTHSTYCDGKNPPEEMVRAAIAQGLVSLGFSGHSFTPCDPSYCMLPHTTQQYRQEILQLKEKYRGQIELYLGMEMDFYADQDVYQDTYDYLIGSVHYVFKERSCLAIDHSRGIQVNAVADLYGGDWMGLVRDYYDTMVRMAHRVRPDIIGHFDVITKFDQDDCLFDTHGPVYRKLATDAIDAILPVCRVFELNTGAIARGKRRDPYFGVELLRYLREKGGEIMLNSDCHDCDYLLCAFDEAADMARAAGFTRSKVILGGGMTDAAL